jgi:hypothetical protein
MDLAVPLFRMSCRHLVARGGGCQKYIGVCVQFVPAKGEQKVMDRRLMSVFRPQHIIMLSWNTFLRPVWDLRYSDWLIVDCQNLLNDHIHTYI